MNLKKKRWELFFHFFPSVCWVWDPNFKLTPAKGMNQKELLCCTSRTCKFPFIPTERQSPEILREQWAQLSSCGRCSSALGLFLWDLSGAYHPSEELSFSEALNLLFCEPSIKRAATNDIFIQHCEYLPFSNQQEPLTPGFTSLLSDSFVKLALEISSTTYSYTTHSKNIFWICQNHMFTLQWACEITCRTKDKVKYLEP